MGAGVVCESGHMEVIWGRDTCVMLKAETLGRGSLMATFYVCLCVCACMHGSVWLCTCVYIHEPFFSFLILHQVIWTPTPRTSDSVDVVEFRSRPLEQ